MSKIYKRLGAAVVGTAVIAGAASVGVWASVASGSADVSPAATGSCKIAKVAFSTETALVSTSSTSYVDIPGMTVPITVGGRAPTCLKVEFSAQVLAQNDQVLDLQALLDGSVQSTTGSMVFSWDDDEDGDGGGFRSHGLNFAFANVAAGAHTLKLQWRSRTGGDVAMNIRSMFVNYR